MICGKMMMNMTFTKTDYDKYIKSLVKFMVKEEYTKKPLPQILLNTDKQDGVFINTGNYDPDRMAVRVYITDRHPKDVLRSLAHELIHHKQNIEGRLGDNAYSGDKITEDNKLVSLEIEAYKDGNMAFRSWTETMQKKKGELK